MATGPIGGSGSSGLSGSTGLAGSSNGPGGPGTGGERSSGVVERPPFVPPGALVPVAPVAVPQPAPTGARKRTVLAAGVAVAVAAIGTAAYFGYQAYSGPNEPLTLPSPIPSVDPQIPEPEDTLPAEPTPAETTMLDSDRTDPKKLGLKEAFGQKRVVLNGRTYVRVKADITAQCGKFAVGTFATALKQQKCTRVLRATYVDARRKYAITTGIAVFPTKAAAVAADRKKNLGKTIWFRGLAGPAGSGADKADISGGYAAGLVWGRYIVFSFATYSDGHTPTKQEKDLGPVSGVLRDHTAGVLEKRLTD
ncbi:hypothetical protein [Sphaerisporangium aureirubrum]|uniref:Uncharacterized protein n=1 Tax=Sphaerisporangium aureirubrum TaxID=1544736 RepID=A0ABW1NTN6_9ACTN